MLLYYLLGKSSKRLSLAESMDDKQTGIDTNKTEHLKNMDKDYASAPEVLEDPGRLIDLQPPPKISFGTVGNGL
jgi:hypothetical protein